MAIDDVRRCLIDIIRCYLSGGSFDGECDEQAADVFAMLKRHDLLHLASVVLSRDAKNRERFGNLVKSQFAAVMRYEKGKYVRDRIYDLFEANEIPFLPLKGAVICDYYEEPWHRTSCDIDILVHNEDLDRATELLQTELKFKFDHKSKHDVSLYSPEGVHFELHFDFHEEGIAPEDGWKAATPIEGKKYHYALSHEAFALHHIAHTAKHFKYSGCGIRFFVDLWIIVHRMGFDKEKLEVMLENKGLLKFAENAFALAEYWFGDATETEMIKKMSDYILEAGIYGSTENRVVIGQKKHKNKFNYALSRIFLPHNIIKRRYPILEKHKWLLPVCQVRRWGDLVFKERKLKSARNEFELNSKVDNNKKDAVLGLLSELEIV